MRVDCENKCEYFGYGLFCGECIHESTLKNNFKRKVKKIPIKKTIESGMYIDKNNFITVHGPDFTLISTELYDVIEKKFGEYLEV